MKIRFMQNYLAILKHAHIEPCLVILIFKIFDDDVDDLKYIK